MTSETDKGIVEIASRHTVDGTVRRLERILAANGIKLFALIDHSGEAERAGLAMEPTKLLIFGNPKAGTPLMTAVPSSAIDLPLKLLIREDHGQVWISYNSPAYLRARHGVPEELLPNITGIAALAEKAAGDE